MGTVRVEALKLRLSEDYRSGRVRVRFDFWSFVDQSGGPDACWPWLRGHDSAGYGQGPFGWTNKAHRQSYRLTFGDFDHSLDVCHSCDNPPCCNPAHLWLGTRADNIMDASRKGRLNTARGEGHSQAKLNWDKVHAIRARIAAGESQGALSREYGVTQPCIYHVVHEATWPESRCPIHGTLAAPSPAEQVA